MVIVMRNVSYLKWFCCALVAFGIACGSVINFKFDDKISTARGVFITAMGVIFFASLAECFNKWFKETQRGQRIQRQYSLMLSDVLEINNKTVSAIQAILSSTAGFIVCQSSCRRSFLHASHFMSNGYAWFGAAYFIYDMWYMYKVYTQKLHDQLAVNANGANEKSSTQRNINDNRSVNISFLYFCYKNPVMIIHHTFLGSFGLLVIVYLRGDFGDCVYSFIYLMELSTPFVSVRSVLSIFGLKQSKAYVINGIAMLVSFFFCRILMWPYVFWWYSGIVHKGIFEAISSLPLTCKIGTLILFLPQLYWFYLMVHGAVKILSPTRDHTKRIT